MDPDLTKNPVITLAKIISVVFHPLFMPLYGLAIIYTAPTIMGFLPVAAKKLLFMIIFMNNVVLPVVMLPLLKNRNLISSYSIDERNERIVPLVAVAILYTITSYIILRIHLPSFLKSFIFASTILVFVITIINLWWKISIHAVGAGSLVAVVAVLSAEMLVPLSGYLISSIIIGGLVLFARLQLNAHNPAQVWTGFFTGFFGLSLFILLL